MGASNSTIAIRRGTSNTNYNCVSTDIFPKVVWDAGVQRDKWYDPFAYCTFTFYNREFSKEEFNAYGVHNPYIEAKVKEMYEGVTESTHSLVQEFFHKNEKYVIGYISQEKSIHVWMFGIPRNQQSQVGDQP